jgi:cell envelope opacity-associated protein A
MYMYARTPAYQKLQALCQSSSLPKTTSPMPELESAKNHKPYARAWGYQKPHVYQKTQALCQTLILPKTTSPMSELEATKNHKPYARARANQNLVQANDKLLKICLSK